MIIDQEWGKSMWQNLVQVILKLSPQTFGGQSATGKLHTPLPCNSTIWEMPHTMLTNQRWQIAHKSSVIMKLPFPSLELHPLPWLSHYPCWLLYQSDENSIWFESVLLASGEYLFGLGGIRRHFDNFFISSCSSWILIFSQRVGGWWVCNSCLLVTTGSKKLL